ncbi:lectin-like protein [Hyunsoonleella aestuarii]|uniref:C-type lectin domain-containing protein n=1 Tax=Hyunsoonleella aestuarii TaxID=912802 RepID=A0ABP8EAR8_9FLAO|nr:lectin-like protein [Hyunsoonleella aestuarii]
MNKLCMILIASNLVLNLSAQNKNALKTQSLYDSKISIPSSLTITNKYIWLPKLVSLPAVISYDVKFNDESGPFIPVYSYNKVKWGNNNPSPDALSWFLSPQNRNFTFRTGLFKSFPNVHRGENIKIEIGKLFNVTCVIHKSSAIYYVDGKPYAKAIYDEGAVPKEGYFGFAVWGIANIKVTNIKLVSPYSSHTEKSNFISSNLNKQANEFKVDGGNVQLQIYSNDEVMELNKLLYKKRDTTLITGKLIDYDIDEKIMMEVNYKEGEPDGVSRVWYENGQLQFETNIKEGEPDGVSRVWFENGQLEKEVNSKEGKQEGLFRQWHKNGQLKDEGNFKNNKQDGLGRMWYENGKLQAEQNYKDGIQEGILRKWYPNGQLQEEFNFKDDRQHGLARKWYENGQIKAKTNFLDGKQDGLLTDWYEDGQLKGKANFQNGKAEGISKVWYLNGQLARELNLIEGVKDGLFREWYENGFQKTEQPFKKGKPEGLCKEWYGNGQLKQEANIIQGVQDGLTREWYENGQQKIEQLFKKGKPEGLYREWYVNGQQKKEQLFREGKVNGVDREWFENGQMQKEMNFFESIPEGLYREWFENGQLKVKVLLKKGDPEGLSKEWYENGQLKREATFKDGKQEGVEKVWNTDGKLIKEALPQTTMCYVEGEIPTLINTFIYSGHKYQYMKMNVSWDIAEKLAEKEGGYLAVFETLEEMNYVTEASEKKATYWIGLSDSEKEGHWTWINGIALNKNMEGYLEKGNDLENRDYGHIMGRGGLLSRQISGRLPNGWKGQMCVSGYLVEFDSFD